MRKPVAITMPADEAVELLPVLLACREFYERMDGPYPAVAATLLQSAYDAFAQSIADQLTPDEVDRLTRNSD